MSPSNDTTIPVTATTLSPPAQAANGDVYFLPLTAEPSGSTKSSPTTASSANIAISHQQSVQEAQQYKELLKRLEYQQSARAAAASIKVRLGVQTEHILVPLDCTQLIHDNKVLMKELKYEMQVAAGDGDTEYLKTINECLHLLIQDGKDVNSK